MVITAPYSNVQSARCWSSSQLLGLINRKESWKIPRQLRASSANWISICMLLTFKGRNDLVFLFHSEKTLANSAIHAQFLFHSKNVDPLIWYIVYTQPPKGQSPTPSHPQRQITWVSIARYSKSDSSMLSMRGTRTAIRSSLRRWSRGRSQSLSVSQCESRNTRTSLLASLAPSRRARGIPMLYTLKLLKSLSSSSFLSL